MGRSLDERGRVLRAEFKVKYAFVAEHRPVFSVRLMCRCLGIHPSGFYAWLKEPVCRRSWEDARQTQLMRQAWAESDKVYGYRKLAASRLSLSRIFWIGNSIYPNPIKSG